VPFITYLQIAAAKGKKSGSSKASKGKRKRQPEENNAEGGEAGEDAEEAALVDPMDNPFSDIARWTAGALKGHGDTGSKKRRTK